MFKHLKRYQLWIIIGSFIGLCTTIYWGLNNMLPRIKLNDNSEIPYFIITLFGTAIFSNIIGFIYWSSKDKN